MRKQMKIRLAVFLVLMMVLPSIVSVLPMTATEVSAASGDIYVNWDYQWGYQNSDVVQVEKGQKFYVGDYVTISEYAKSGKFISSKVASLLKATYTSSKKSVATVDKKGYLTTKGTGTTTITVKYKGKKVSRKLKVVPTGDFGYGDDLAAIQKKAEELATKIPKKVTAKNGFSIIKLKTDYEEFLQNSENSAYGINTNGMILNYAVSGTTRELVVPQASRYNVINRMLGEYASKNSPTSTRSSKVLKIKSASAKTNQITIKLKNKVSAEQLLAAKCSYTLWGQPKGSNKAYIYVYFHDSAQKTYYYGKGELVKGSKVIKVTPYKYSSKTYKYVRTKLKKGKTYVLGSKTDWTKGKSVKVK